MVAGFLVDTSVLRVFTSIERLDLLANWTPLVITPEILREHGKSPARGIHVLSKALSRGEISLEMPNLQFGAKSLAASNPALSLVDAESILYAERKDYAVFVADVAYRSECKKRGVPISGVASVLLALRRMNRLTASEVKALAADLEAQGYYQFNAGERKGLGI